MTLSLGTAYRSFGGEVEASSTPTICRLPDSRRHQLWAIAQCENTQGTARRNSTWIPPRFSSSYLSFCWLAAAGTAGAAGIKQRNPAAKSPLLALLQRLRQNLFVISIERSATLFWRL